MNTCETCKFLSPDKKQTENLGRPINFCDKLAEDSGNEVAHVLSVSVGSLLIMQPDKFGCVFHKEKK